MHFKTSNRNAWRERSPFSKLCTQSKISLLLPTPRQDRAHSRFFPFLISCAFHRAAPAVDLVALQLSRRPVHRVCLFTDLQPIVCAAFVCACDLFVFVPRDHPFPSLFKRYRSFYGHFRDCAPWVFRDIFSSSLVIYRDCVRVVVWMFCCWVFRDTPAVIVFVSSSSCKTPPDFLIIGRGRRRFFFSSTLSSRRI